jgi:mRNA interferase MazF
MTRGDIWWADLGIPVGSEPGFRRPVLLVQSDYFTASRINTVICIPFTTNLVLADAPGNVFINKSDTGLGKDSVAIVSHLTCMDKARFIEKVSALDPGLLIDVEEGILLVLGMEPL